MGCRVKVRLSAGGRSITTSALVNSGFESDRPDIMVPVNLARLLGLWPPSRVNTVTVETGGGDVELFYASEPIDLELLLGDKPSRRLRVNVLVNPYVHEVALSDHVASELGIVLLDIKRGLWRLKDDSPDVVRETAPEELW